MNRNARLAVFCAATIVCFGVSLLPAANAAPATKPAKADPTPAKPTPTTVVAPTAGPVENLDEMFRRAQRRLTATWPREMLEDDKAGFAWQPETFCYRDVLTGHEVWKITDTPDTPYNPAGPVKDPFFLNYYHNDIAMTPWSADGKRMALVSRRISRKSLGQLKSPDHMWFVVNADGSLMRPTLNNAPYMHWSPLLSDTYYTLGGARIRDYKSDGNILYKGTIPDTGSAIASAKPILTLPVVDKTMYNLRKLTTADGKMIVVHRTDFSKGWDNTQTTFIPVQVFPEDQVKTLTPNGYSPIREYGDYVTKRFDKGSYHDAYMMGDGTWFYFLDNECGWWIAKTLGSAPDGGPVFSEKDGKFGDVIPIFVRKLGKKDDPWGKNAEYPGHPCPDRWGQYMVMANYDTFDAAGKWKQGCTVYDFFNHKPLMGNWIPQSDGCSHTDWEAYADYCVTSVEANKDSGNADPRIECFPYDQQGKNFIVCHTHNHFHGRDDKGEGYNSLMRPAQSPDGTKVAWHSDFLNGNAATDCYWAVCYYPYAPKDIKATAADGAVKITFQSPSYSKRPWPKAADPVPPAREIKAYHLWRAKSDKGPWEEVAAVTPTYKVNGVRGMQEPQGLECTDKPGDGTWYYAMTSQEHSGLESDKLSEIIKVDVSDGGKTVSASQAAPAGQKDYWKTAPAAPKTFTAKKLATAGQYELKWTKSDDAKVRYYNLYYSTEGAPEAKPQNRFASVPVSNITYLDWLADPQKPGFYAITCVDRQGNESAPLQTKP